jgi:hypothetical protein
MKLFCGILPDLQNRVGHVYQYNLSTQEAVEKIGWKYVAWIPVGCEIDALPSNWLKILPSTTGAGRRKWIGRLLEPVHYFLAFKKALKNLDSRRETIFFLEHFRIVHLFSLFLALLGRRSPFQRANDIWR